MWIKTYGNREEGNSFWHVLWSGAALCNRRTACLFFSNTQKKQTQRGSPLQRTFSRKWSVRQPLTNLWSVCASLVCILSSRSYWMIQILKNTGAFWENSPRILSIWRLILHNDVSRDCVVRKWCQSILKEGKWGFLNSARVDGVGLKTVFSRMWTCRPQWTGFCVFTRCTPPVAFRTITCMCTGSPRQAFKVTSKTFTTEEWGIQVAYLQPWPQIFPINQLDLFSFLIDD